MRVSVCLHVALSHKLSAWQHKHFIWNFTYSLSYQAQRLITKWRSLCVTSDLQTAAANCVYQTLTTAKWAHNEVTVTQFGRPTYSQGVSVPASEFKSASLLCDGFHQSLCQCRYNIWIPLFAHFKTELSFGCSLIGFCECKTASWEANFGKNCFKALQ